MRVLKHPAVLIGIAAIAGTVFGLLVGDWADNIKFVGDLFIRLVQMAIVPLVMASVIVATASMSGSGAGKIAGRTFAWMIGFSAVAAVLGWALSALIQPGAGMSFTGELDPTLQDSAATGAWQETITNFVSTNIFAAMSTATMVPIIAFSLLFGVALNITIRKTGNTLLLNGLTQLQQVILTMIRLVMYIAPIGVFCLIAPLAGAVGFSVIGTALAYLGTTLAGVIIVTVLFVVVFTIVTHLNPAHLPRKLAEQTAIAVTTTSSAVTYPTVLKNTVELMGISPRVANFTLSVGLTMGSYGAVLNYVVVIFFLAQAGGITLTPGQVVLGLLLAILLNMGTITVPGGFPVVGTFLATALGLPIQALGLLIAVDWFTGIMRTFINVNGDTFVAALVANRSNDIDRAVYNGTAAPRTLTSEELDIAARVGAADEDTDTLTPTTR